MYISIDALMEIPNQTNPMNAQTINSQVSKFSSLALAKSFASKCKKMQLIVMGDDSRYWVASASFATKLEKLGYEIV